MSLEIRHGLPEPYRAAAADLYWQAFGGKLGVVMGPEARAQTYLRQVMQMNHCFGAIQNNALLGVVGFHGRLGSFAGGTAQDFRTVYGSLRGIWRLALLWAVGGKNADVGALMIDGFCVQASARNLGVGTALLTGVIAYARAQGFNAVQLDVIADNWRARAFYQRHGFGVQSQRNIGPLGWIFGFDRTVRMTRSL